MSDRRTEHDYESEELLMNDDFDYDEPGEDEELQEEQAQRSRFNLSMRHRIEERLEERRLRRELDDYDDFGPDDEDDDILH